MLLTMKQSSDDPKYPSGIEAVNKHSEDALSSDHIFKEIGEFGIFQILVGFASGAALILASLTIYNFIFAADIPEYR